MVVIKRLDKEELLNNIQGLEINQEVSGAYTVSLTSYYSKDNYGYDLLRDESILIIDGMEFRIKQLNENKTSKQITAVNTFFDLVDKRQDSIYGGTRTFEEFATFVLGGSGWTFTYNIPNDSRLIANFGEENIVTLIDQLITVYECEYKILAGNKIQFTSRLGSDTDFQYRYGYNVKALRKKVDTTNLKTYIKGYGANNLYVAYTSPFASDPNVGIREQEPVYDDRFTRPDSMLEHLKRTLTDVPKAYFEMDTVELTSRELGDKVWLIYEPLNIEFETRILKVTKTTRNDRIVTTKVVLGNSLPQNSNDILVSQKVEIDHNRKEYRSRFEQTNDRITLEVEAVNSSISKIELKADNIELSVKQLDGELGNLSSEVNIQAGLITQKVSYTDYNGQTVTSMIVQDPGSIKLLADNLELQGLVTFTNLKTPGQTVIDGGNVYGQRFVVGNGTGSTLTMTSTLGSHTITSNDANGFRISSNGTLSLQAGGGQTVYANSKFWASNGFQVSGFAEFDGNMDAQLINATEMRINNDPVISQSVVDVRIKNANDQLERELVAWANGKFVQKP